MYIMHFLTHKNCIRYTNILLKYTESNNQKMNIIYYYIMKDIQIISNPTNNIDSII